MGPPVKGGSGHGVRRAPFRGIWVATVLTGLLPGGVPPAAAAASPGANGRITFISERPALVIFTMKADGSEQTNLTATANDSWPAWSPDGTRIAFTTERDGNREIYVMNADGTGQVNLTSYPALDQRPDWQPLFPKTVILKAKPKKVEKGERTRLRAQVTPRPGHEGDAIEFYRKAKLIAATSSSANCVAILITWRGRQSPSR